MRAATASRLELIYARLHRADEVQRDPILWVRRYRDPLDREIAGLIAATVAFGHIRQIMDNVGRVLAPMGDHPFEWLKNASDQSIRNHCAGWRHRWATGDELAELLQTARDLIRARGSLGAAWAAARVPEDRDTHDTLQRWVSAFDAHGLTRENSLVSRPERGSACKRWHLYLRWMIRCDVVDPGGWADSPARLIYPLDTHIFRFARANGFTRRRAADIRTAREITARFRRIDPADPVRFDFALVRHGVARGG